MHVERFDIDERFRGPPRSGNGGYVCGRVAARFEGPVAVRLRMPPPLNTGLRLESSGDAARLFNAETLVGEARPTQLNLQAPPPPSHAVAVKASTSFIGHLTHSFPGCFVCGPERAAGDGLRIFPGAVPTRSMVAAPWTPDESLADASGVVKPEFLWSALDCTGVFALFPLSDGVALVLGELAASITGSVRPGERCVVTGWSLGVEGRKHFAGTAVYAPGGSLVAMARAVWIGVPLSSWT